MGILDGVLGSVMGSVAGTTGQQNSGAMGAVMGLIQQNGGLGGVLEMFNTNGLAEQAKSWVSTGPNMDIDASHVQQVFGGDSIGALASQLGLSQDQAGGASAQLLPQLIDQFTPSGHVPENHQDVLSQALSMLRGASS